MMGEATKSEGSNYTIGSRIESDGYVGTVRYFGELPSTTGVWLGIEWDNPERGKHDGMHEDHRYFYTKNPKSGSFIRPKKANKGISFLAAIRSRYAVEDEGHNDDMFLEETSVQIVGVKKLHDRRSLERLVEADLAKMYIFGLGSNGIESMMPVLTHLNLSGNLLPSWADVADITRHLPHLSHLTLSYNRLTLCEEPKLLSSAFSQVTFLCLNYMDYDWSQVAQSLQLFTDLRELHVSFNTITNITHLPSSIHNVKILHISGNPINNWQQVLILGSLAMLEELYITNSPISSISFPDTSIGQVTPLFSSLKRLRIASCEIADWVSVGELNKLANLSDLIMTKNPVLNGIPEYEAFGMTLTKLPRLVVLNKRPITANERRDSEIDYWKKYATDWRLSGGHEDPAQNKPSDDFLAQHPTYELLVKRFGAVHASELVPQNKKIRMISVTIESPLLPDKPHIPKKLPVNMTIQKLRLLLQKLYDNKVKPWKMILSYRSTQMPDMEIPLDHDLRDLDFFSVENGDAIIVRWR